MTITPDEIVLFRIAERLGLSLIVLLVALVVMVGFWRSVQKLDVSDGGRRGVAGRFALSTPVFVLLAIIGYAWVSLSFPIQVSGPAAPAEATAAAGGPQSFVGIGMPGRPADAGPARAAPPDPGYALGQAQRMVRAINCAAKRAAPDERLATDLTRARLALLAPVWPSAWGEPAAFADAVLGISGAEPNPLALEQFDRVDASC